MATNYAVETVSSLPFGMLIGAPLMAGIEAQTQAAKATVDFILQVGFLPPSAVNAAGALVADPDPVDVTQPDAVPAATDNPSTNAGQTRMVTFTYTTTNEDPAVVAAAANAAAAAPNATPATIAAAVAATNQTATITVPILSVVPIPFFSIDEMTIDFVAKITEAITASSRATSQTVKSASAQGRGGWGPVSGSFKAGMSSTNTSTSQRSSKYQTELTMTIHVRASSESMPKGMAKVLDMLAGLIKSERT
jgi:hypothetical protein